MILIADSGSTKTTWSLIVENEKIKTCNTSGINPFFLGKEEIIQILSTEYTLEEKTVDAIYFYGAGCIPAKVPVLTESLSEFFATGLIEVNSDLLAAARSLCYNKEGIACILGTGSNSCYYDGNNIVNNVSPLGFILGDEGSGAVLGKKLIADILKNQLQEELQTDFFATYSLTPPEILEKVYRQPFPNRFLAQFTTFIAKHTDNEAITDLISTSFEEFIRRNLFQYKNKLHLPIHFTGSIAYYFQDILEQTIQKTGLIPGKITKAPMEGLIHYHLNIHH